MARLVGICRDSGSGDDDAFRKHQLPVFVEDMRTMIVEFDDPCAAYTSSVGGSGSSRPSLKQFREKISSLKPEELYSALAVDSETFSNTLSQLVPCVGCRRSTEKLFNDLSKMGHPAVFPLTITPNLGLTVHNSYFPDEKLLYRLLITDGQKVRHVIENLTKCRKNNKRCLLHSMDVHMCRSKLSWEELWDLMSEDCRDECCVVESDSLLDMLETYLEKHRFCTECRAKVMKAYNLLVGEGDKSQEKGYNPLIYQGLRYCPSEQHLHLKPSVQYLNALIDRAEPELMGGRERHAKTLDVAQGEVLTCLGLYMYDRLHRLVTALRTLQTTFQLLYCTGIIALHTNFQETLERKHGLSDSLERLCAELQDSAANPAVQTQRQQALAKGTHGHNCRNATAGTAKRSKKKPSKSSSASFVSETKNEPANEVLSAHEDQCPRCTRRSSSSSADSPPCSLEHSPRLSSSPVRAGSLDRLRPACANKLALSTCAIKISSTDTISEECKHKGINEQEDCVNCTISKSSERKLLTGAADDDECSSAHSCCHDPGYCSQEFSPGGGSPSGACRSIRKSKKIITTSLTCPCEADMPEILVDDKCSHGDHKKGECITNNEKAARTGSGGLCSLCSLLDMLEEESDENKGNDSANEDSLISPEDVQWFRENESLVLDKRRALRERLIRQFRDMQERMQARNSAHQ